MSTKEYAGKDLAEIREYFAGEGYTAIHEDKGTQGFDLFRPWDNLPPQECAHVIVWPRTDGGFWSEEY